MFHARIVEESAPEKRLHPDPPADLSSTSGCHAGGWLRLAEPAKRHGTSREKPAGERRKADNWLKWLDKIALTLPRAFSWLQPYDYFLLPRCPHLQPLDPGSRDYKNTFHDGKRTYEQQLREEQGRISDNLDARRVLEGLSEDLSRQLAALVFDLTVELEEQVSWTTQPKQFEKCAREVARLERKLESFTRRAQADVRTMLDAVAALERLGAGRRIHDSLERVSREIAALQPALPASYFRELREAVKESDYFQLVANDPATLAMVQLYWFFHHGCGLPVGESEVRVALIRNNLWSKKAGTVNYAVGSTEESRGCDAVRQAVNRYRLPEGTKP
jgi:hypothetical protein